MIKGTENLALGDLISRRVPFVVPMYQRAYAWESGSAEEVDDYVNDLKTLYEARVQKANPIRHFFGGLVSIDRFAPNTATGHVLEVVDGQQRLATFVMTIALLVRAMEQIAQQAVHEKDSDAENDARAYAQQTQHDYLKYDEVIGGQLHQRLRLSLSKADRQFFEQLVDGKHVQPTRGSHERLERAMKKIQSDLIQPLLTADPKSHISDKLHRILILRSCLTDDCHVIHIVSDDHNEAYRLFAILNDRGRSLSDGDLLRSHTLEMLEGHEALQTQAEEYWDYILSAMPSEVDRFSRTYYASQVGKRAPKRELFDIFRKRFFNQPARPLSATDATAVEQRVRNMRLESEVFTRIREGEWPYDDSVVTSWERSRLERLTKVLRHELCVPLLMSAFSQWRTEEAKFSGLVNLLERFSFRYVSIVGGHPERLEGVYLKHAQLLRASGNAYEVKLLRDDLHTLQEANASEAVFKVRLEQHLNYGKTLQNRVIKYFLTTLEDYYNWLAAGASGIPQADMSRIFDVNVVTIEHIYPQNPSTRVPQLESLKNNVGNLTLWGPNDNRAAANAPFEAKRALYAASSIAMTRELAQLPEWSKEALIARRNRIWEMAAKLFTV